MTEFRFDEQKMTSLRHRITDEIRKAIFTGRLKPGDRLREVEMSRQMGVSRGPIREAMRMLEQEGLLFSQPYKETMVAEVTGEEVQEVLIPIRLTLETFALKKALPFIGDPEFERLSSFVARMKEAAQVNQLHQIVELDIMFHEYLLSLADMPGLLNTWTSICNRIRLYFIQQGQTYGNLDLLWKEHEALLAVIRKGDFDAIAEELATHIYRLHNEEE
ncbi:GntR family transcriptional regulator [Paenibacillus flagellatus]|uniref:GntR family transcriptional regulator n=1 Tax=Paenibacillus flagellatus TaxID=2211139 RepID=A0A2V5KBW8_9BACL|nr:GntR family transcriptional regulator [Paenibacillus flagellatus]PYI55644.1 GntR family transcriptional regulator [Paenibacillus flagellatus]